MKNLCNSKNSFPALLPVLKGVFHTRLDFFIPILSCLLTATNYEITYISHTETSLVMLKLYFYCYLSLLARLLISQQIHPALLKCK